MPTRSNGRISRIYFRVDDLPSKLILRTFDSDAFANKFNYWKNRNIRINSGTPNQTNGRLIIPHSVNLEPTQAKILAIKKNASEYLRATLRQTNTNTVFARKRSQVQPVELMSNHFIGFSIRKGYVKQLESQFRRYSKKLNLELELVD